MNAKHHIAHLKIFSIIFIATIVTLTGCDETFNYQIGITEFGTARAIENAIVRLKVGGMSPLQGKSDTFGNARIIIPSDYVNKEAQLIIEIPGYKIYTQNITLLNDGQLPTDIPLKPLNNLDEQSVPEEVPAPIDTATPLITHPPTTPIIIQETETPIVEKPTPSPSSTATATPTPVSATETPEAPQIIASPNITPQKNTPTLSGKLAFPLKINDEYKVYVVQVSDAPPAQLYASIGNARQPQLSPDGAQLLVDGMGTRDLAAILQMTSDGYGAHPVTCPSITVESYLPTWSPDSTQLAFDGGNIHVDRRQIYIDDLAKNDCDLDDNHLVVQGKEAIDNNGLFPIWSLDNWLYFRSCATWDIYGSGTCGIWGTQMNGGGFDQITNNPNHIPTDANNQHLLFMFNDNGNWDIYRVNSHSGGSPRNLTQNGSSDIWGTLSPDGQTVAFMSNRSGYWAIWFVNIDGSNPREWLKIDTYNWGRVNTDEIYFERMSWRK